MGKLAKVIYLVFSIILTLQVVCSIDQDPNSVESWLQNLANKTETITKLHFYFHDIWSGKSPTATEVARSNMTSNSPTFFGSIDMIDDPLTLGPEPNSIILGRAQGFYGSTGIKDLALLMTMNLVFTSGDYNGSTLSVLGRNSAMQHYKEMSIVGGSGVFRLARGIVTAHTHWFNASSGDAIVEYNVLVLHY